jgi:hypothetical protein
VIHNDDAPDRLTVIRRIRAQHEASWRRIDGVAAIGTGITADGSAGIVVSVERDLARVRALIPRSVDGVMVEIRTSGELRALGTGKP